MTVDIRAEVTCNLGTIISGSVSDTYSQGTGIIYTRGQLVLKRTTPVSFGANVTITVTIDGVSETINRGLKVIGSAVDPLKGVVNVELACYPTFVKEAKPAPLEIVRIPGQQVLCLFDDSGEVTTGDKEVPIRIRATDILLYCAGKINLDVNVVLANHFFRSSFDLSSGYINVISDLLHSENKVLWSSQIGAQVIKKVQPLSTILRPGDIIELEPASFGPPVPKIAYALIDGIKLKQPYPDKEVEKEIVETEGDRQTITVRWTNEDGDPVESNYDYIPYTRVETTFHLKPDTNNECNIEGSLADEDFKRRLKLAGKPKKKETFTRLLFAEAANGYCSEVLTKADDSSALNPANTAFSRTLIEYTYDKKAELEETIESVFIPEFAWAGSLGILFTYPEDAGNGQTNIVAVPLNDTEILIEKTTTTYEYTYSDPTVDINDEGVEPTGQKVKTIVYRNLYLRQQGQQGAASIRDFAKFQTLTDCVNWLGANSKRMVLDDSQVTQTRFQLTATQERRLSDIEQAIKDYADQRVVADPDVVAFTLSSGVGNRTINPPYQDEDYYTGTGVVVKSKATKIVPAYLAAQVFEMAAYRNGFSVKVPFSKAPKGPLAGVNIIVNGYGISAVAEGITYSFSSDGIICSFDAMVYGLLGSYQNDEDSFLPGGFGAEPWVELPDGYNPTLIPAGPLPDQNGIIDSPYVIPPFNLSTEYRGITYTNLDLTVKNYSIVPVEVDLGVVPTRTKALVSPIRTVSADAAAFTVSGQAASYFYGRGIAGAAGSLTLSGMSSGFVRDYVIGTNAGTFTLTGLDANLPYQRLPLALDAASFAVSGQDAQFLIGKTMVADAGAFSLTGEAAQFSRPDRVVTGDAGTFTTTGQDAGLVYAAPQFAVVTYTGNGTTTNAVTGLNFTPGFVWTKRISSTSDHNLHTAAGESISGSNYFVVQTNNSNAAPNDPSPYVTFDSNGFTLKTTTFGNVNSASYIAWCWQAGSAMASNTDGTITTKVSVNNTVGISHMRYTGTGSAASVGHGLGVAPDIIFFKNLSAGGSNTTVAGPIVGASDQYLFLSSSQDINSSSFLNTTTSSSVITLGGSTAMNSPSGVIAIAFVSVSGYSKHSTYTGNGSSTQAITGLGFQPSFVIVKSKGFGDWVMFTAGRDGRFIGNSNAAEAATDYITFNSNGFTLESGAGVNTNGVVYLYMAFA